MKNRFFFIKLLVVLMFLGIIIGCGNGSNMANTEIKNIVYSGVFIDSPVKGLIYKTDSQKGFTDENGTFKYKKNEYISFYLGNIFLGKVKAEKIITPYTLGESTPKSPSNKTINIALLLQNCDRQISEKFIDVEDYNNFEFDYISLKQTPEDFIKNLEKEGITVHVDEDSAIKNLNKSINYQEDNATGKEDKNSTENNTTTKKYDLQIPTISQEQKKEFLDAVNEARSHEQDCGEYGKMPAVEPLTWNDKLYKSSYTYSYDMANAGAWNHIGSNTKYDIVAKNERLGHGSHMSDRIKYYQYNYKKIGENIAKGYKTTKEVVKAWLESDGHCKNLMDPDFTEMGMALTKKSDDKYGSYWTLDFGHPK